MNIIPAGAGPAPRLSDELKARLGISFASAYGREWSLPKTAPPLSEEQTHFLQSNTVSSLGVSSGGGGDPIAQFLLQVAQGIVTGAVVGAIQEAITGPAPSSSTGSVLEDAQDASSAESVGRTEDSAAKAPRVERGIDVAETVVDGSDGSAEEMVSPTGHREEGAVRHGGKDPSVETMKKITVSRVNQRIQGSITKLIKGSMNELGERVGEGRFLKALGEGKDLAEAASIRAEGVATHKGFVQHAGKVIAAAAKTGVFLSKVEEIGWQGATAETAQSIAGSFLAKYTGKALATVMGCTNPAWCAAIVATMVQDVFTPTELAPAAHDGRPPLPLPFPMPPLSQMPELDPPGPILRAPR